MLILSNGSKMVIFIALPIERERWREKRKGEERKEKGEDKSEFEKI